MAKMNMKKEGVKTHEGAPALKVNPELQLRRSVLSCLLWESEFYEDGVSIAERIAGTIPRVKAEKVAAIAVEARSKYHLRHVPLWIVREMARLDSHKGLVADILEQVIQRADELMEFVALYWKDGRQPLSAQVKRGLAAAFRKFDEYSLAKYSRPGEVKLRDVLFLCHAKPKDDEQAALWKRLVDGKMKTPDTWETSLSNGEDKCAAFERLMSEGKLGGMAFLRNLRNMLQSNVDEGKIKEYFQEPRRFAQVLPFRFIAAARYAPQLEPEIEKAMLAALSDHDKLLGKTVLLIDVSGSMSVALSSRSETSRMDTAAALAILAREICEEVRIFTFSNACVEIPPRRGFALRDAVFGSQPHQGTYLGDAVEKINEIGHDRLVVFTDEQSHDWVPDPQGRENYLVNVASNENGIGYGKWTHIDGFSEAILDWMAVYETTQLPCEPEKG